MFGTLEFVMVAALFANLVFVRGAAVLAWLKKEEAVVVKDANTVVNDVKKL